MLLQLDFSTAAPIYQQIRDQIVRGIAEGELAPGERLPTVRALASECGVNAMTVSKAYQLLKQESHRIVAVLIINFLTSSDTQSHPAGARRAREPLCLTSHRPPAQPGASAARP